MMQVRDLKTLQGLNWLNDEVINFYMGMIVKRLAALSDFSINYFEQSEHIRSEGPDFPKVFAFSTFFYPKLIDGGHASVKRWSKKVLIHFILIQLSLNFGTAAHFH